MLDQHRHRLLHDVGHRERTRICQHSEQVALLGQHTFLHALRNLLLDAGLRQRLSTGYKGLAAWPRFALAADFSDHVHGDLGNLSLFIGLEHGCRRGGSILHTACLLYTSGNAPPTDRH